MNEVSELYFNTQNNTDETENNIKENIEIAVPEEEIDSNGNKKIILKWKKKDDILNKIDKEDDSNLFIQIKPYDFNDNEFYDNE